jgi:pyrroloquinoline quinone biosynthesis protein D
MSEPVESASTPRLVRKGRLRYDEVRQADLLLLPERVVKLNATGAAILRLCDGERTVAEIARDLEAQYGNSNLEPDILEFLRAAAEHGWIE